MRDNKNGAVRRVNRCVSYLPDQFSDLPKNHSLAELKTYRMSFPGLHNILKTKKKIVKL